MDSLVVRAAVPADLDAVYTMFTLVKKQLAADHIPIWTEDDYPSREIFTGDIAAGWMLVAEQAGRIVGSVSWNADLVGEYFFDAATPAEGEAAARKMAACCGAPPEAAVSAHRLMVLPTARHSGAAAALLCEVERRSRGHWMIFFAAPENAPARHLYAKLGYHDLCAYDFSFGKMRYLYKTPAELAGAQK
ncbi:MAG: GNAT family N-acetyltransferase [Faecalibacterium sp.]|jgi:GNAT superfamily N-acetyltransferase|nr:GNAT family N-acetyltransferase [Faecalibacterium sp.]